MVLCHAAGALWGPAAGGDWRRDAARSDQALRAAVLGPAGLAIGGHPVWSAAVWCWTGGAAFLAGAWHERSLAARRHAEAPTPLAPSERRVDVLALTLRTTAWPRETPRGWRVPCAVIASSGPEGPRVGDSLLLMGDGPAPGLWTVLAGVVEAGTPQSRETPGGFDNRRYLRGRGIAWTGRLLERIPMAVGRDPLATVGNGVLAPVRRGVLDRLGALVPPHEAAFFGSVLLAERDPASGEIRGRFQRLGLSHLFAVSGLHVGILAVLLAGLLGALRAGPSVRVAALGVCLPLYAVLVGLSGSVLRAAGLVLTAAAAPVLGRSADGLRTLARLFWLTLLAQPWLIDDAGFRLSYLAAAGIVGGLRVVGPVVAGLPKPLRFPAGSLLVSLAAQWGTLPEIVRSFGWLPPLAAVWNLAAVPLFTVSVWAACGSLALSWIPALGEGAAVWAWLGGRVLQAGTDVVPGSWNPVWGLGTWRAADTGWFLLVGVCAVVVAKSRGRGRGLGTGLLVVSLVLLGVGRSGSRQVMTVHQFAVGQGDAAAFVFPDGRTVLVDTGDAAGDGAGARFAVLPWMQRNGHGRVEAVALTHGHADHTGGVAAVARQLDVGRWCLGGRAEAPAGSTEIVASAVGDTLHAAGDWTLVVLQGAESAERFAHENDRSLVLGLYRRGELRGLWPGDLELEGEARLLEGGRLAAAAGLDVLKAGHHGSRTSSGSPLLERLHPRLVLLSCGVANRHKHPSHGPFVAGGDTLVVVRTDLSGGVTLQWDPAGRFAWRSVRDGEHFMETSRVGGVP